MSELAGLREMHMISNGDGLRIATVYRKWHQASTG